MGLKQQTYATYGVNVVFDKGPGAHHLSLYKRRIVSTAWFFCVQVQQNIFAPHPTRTIKTGWWFGTFFIFPYIGNNHPNWLIFFRGVETTNQKIKFGQRPPVYPTHLSQIVGASAHEASQLKFFFFFFREHYLHIDIYINTIKYMYIYIHMKICV